LLVKKDILDYTREDRQAKITDILQERERKQLEMNYEKAS
jgi:hypothetical protein